jgi:hypothetical protein
MKKFRKFQHIERAEEPKSRKGMYLAIFLAVIMIGGIAGIFTNNPDADVTYGKFDFKNVNGLWETKINKQEVTFYFLPDQLSAVQFDEQAQLRLKNSQAIILSFDPMQNETTKLQALDIFRFELANALASSGKQVGLGVSQNTTLYNFPIITCANSSFVVPVLYAEYSTESSIKLNNDCIIVFAENEQALIRATDYMKYILYGVLE